MSRGCKNGVASTSGVNHMKKSRFLSSGSLSPSSRLRELWAVEGNVKQFHYWTLPFQDIQGTE